MNTSLTSVRLSRFALRFVAIASATLVILSLLLWMEGDFDRRFLLAHNLFRDNPAIVAFAGALSRFGMSAVCLLVLACIAASVRFPAFREVRPVLLVVLFSFCAATLVATLLKEPLGRARPIADLAGQLNVTSRHDSASFPSGHAAQSLALALPFVLIVAGGPVGVRLAKLAMLLVAGLVCYSRIVKGAHYLSDVLAGAGLALVCVPVAVAAANAIYARGKVTPEKLDTVVKRIAAILLALALLLPFL
jgi:membrane-associated phospholipid phosphatase